MRSIALRLEHACVCSYILGTAVHQGSSGHAQWSPVNMQSFFIGASTLASGGHSNALCVADSQPSFTVLTALTALTLRWPRPLQRTLQMCPVLSTASLVTEPYMYSGLVTSLLSLNPKPDLLL